MDILVGADFLLGIKLNYRILLVTSPNICRKPLPTNLSSNFGFEVPLAFRFRIKNIFPLLILSGPIDLIIDEKVLRLEGFG
jgi:hypothetical protein